MHNYEKQFIDLFRSGRQYFWNSNESDYFYFLFNNTWILGKDLEEDRCKKFYKWDDYNESQNKEDIMTDEEATSLSRSAKRELDLLCVLGMATWLKESITGHNYFSSVVATPEALSKMLSTKEETKGFETSYKKLTMSDLNNFRRAYQLADQYERAKEARAKLSQQGFLFENTEQTSKEGF